MTAKPELSDFNYRATKKPHMVRNYGALYPCNNPIDRCGLCYNEWNYSWEHEYLLIIKKIIKSDAIGIDVGAHTGTYGISLKNKIKRMYCFEPSKYPFEALQLNSVLYPHLVPLNYYCGNKYTTGNPETIVLDEFFGKDFKVDFIKIDTDGPDLSILQGATNIIKSNEQLVILIELDIKLLALQKLNDVDFFNTLKQCGLDCSDVHNKIKPLLTDRFFTNILISKKGDNVSSNLHRYYLR